MPASTALVTKAIILYLVMLMPTDSAAMRLSRVAMMARPERLLTRFCTTKRVKRISAKPIPKVAMVSMPTPPLGPLTSSSPGMLLSLKAKCSRPASMEIYRQLITFRMISPKASVTMAR